MELKAKPYTLCGQCYDKDEVDRYIADMEKRHEEQIHKLEFYWQGMVEAKEKEAVMFIADHFKKKVLHQKRKRCLAMAKRCYWNWQYWKDSTPGYERQFQWENRAYRWYKRWLALADEPTWANFLQLIHKEA